MNITIHKGAMSVALSVMLCGNALAQSAQGMWLTQPDDHGQRAIVSSQPCGAQALCGTIVEVVDRNGAQITHRNIGVRLFWDMVPVGKGAYEGQAFVPAMRAKTRATMKVTGREMTVRGCLGPLCKSQVWSRVR